VTVDGSVHNRVIAADGTGLSVGNLPDEGSLARMSRYLSELVAGRTLPEVRAVIEQEIANAREEQRLEEAALRPGSAAVAGGGERRRVLGGKDTGEVRRPAEVRSGREARTRVLGPLDPADEAPGVRIFSGDENPLKELADLSVVTSPYGAGQEVLGTLGVIGP